MTLRDGRYVIFRRGKTAAKSRFSDVFNIARKTLTNVPYHYINIRRARSEIFWFRTKSIAVTGQTYCRLNPEEELP